MKFIVALLALLASDAAMAQYQTFRDANGRTLGRSTTDARAGNTTMATRRWAAAPGGR